MRGSWVWLAVIAVVLCGCGAESTPAPKSAPCKSAQNDKIGPYNEGGPAYGGKAPHLATLIKSDYLPEKVLEEDVDTATDVPVLPVSWQPELTADGSVKYDPVQDGDHGPAYAAQIQLVVCEYLISVGAAIPDAQCGQYISEDTIGRPGIFVDVVRARYRYEVREAKTARLLGTFELNGSGSLPREGVCPQYLNDAKRGIASGVADVVTDKALETALKPYVLGTKR